MNRLQVHRAAKQRARSRLWAWWLSLPVGIRPGVFVFGLIVALIVLGSLAGCAVRPPDSLSGEILQEDPMNCASNPRHPPLCVIGLFVFGKWHF